MKKFIKSIIKAVLIMGICLGLILMCAENADGSCNVLWTLAWLAEMVISAWGLQRLFPEDFKEDTL